MNLIKACKKWKFSLSDKQADFLIICGGSLSAGLFMTSLYFALVAVSQAGCH